MLFFHWLLPVICCCPIAQQNFHLHPVLSYAFEQISVWIGRCQGLPAYDFANVLHLAYGYYGLLGRTRDFFTTVSLIAIPFYYCRTFSVLRIDLYMAYSRFARQQLVTRA